MSKQHYFQELVQQKQEIPKEYQFVFALLWKAVN